MNIFKGYDLDNLKRQPIKEVAQISRTVGAEGIVLLKNDNVLPFDKNKTVSIFGRTQIDYVKSGTGSGGLVKTEYCVTILDGLKGRININEDLLKVYTDWLKENPFDAGKGWATEPWAQKEMPVTDEMCIDASNKSDYALVVIGRTAGESRDNFAGAESYLLTETEEDLLRIVTKHFKKVCVALNTGNIIDMKWVEKYNIPCVLYCWQGGMEGGNAFADVILGDISPSGKLPDTIAYDINDYPSTKNHGNPEKNIYEEDIYVGYRYFETFAKDKVLYPFGFGLSYTNFELHSDAKVENDVVKILVSVKNIGDYSGKTVVQVYFNSPQGKLGKPSKQLVSYAKTKMLEPNETQTMSMEFPVDKMASYDDVDNFAYILEKGEYTIYVGENVRDCSETLKFFLEEKTVKQLRQALAPTEQFNRIKPIENGQIGTEPVTTRKYDINERIKEHLVDRQPTIEAGITFNDVADGKYSLDNFIMQLSDEDLAYIVKGEGMNSPKGTSGTVGAFGGITNSLLSFGIPIACATDGPSGLRFDSGEKASLIPNGTCLAATWNVELINELFDYVGIEVRANNVDILLAPGVNIHRNPLNGRNFEYFSEDPYLAGTIAAAYTKGLDNAGVAGTIKHFACNSQEFKRFVVNTVVSERALREIYLKPFEIAVKTGNASAIMTSYNKINGSHSASNYDLCTSILRDEWGYTGLVMTDWWTNLDDAEPEKKTNLAAMVTAQNDMYMVTPSSEKYSDNLMESLESRVLDRFYLRKCAKNILQFLLNSPALKRKPIIVDNTENYESIGQIKNIQQGVEYDLTGARAIKLEFTTTGSELAQYIINLYENKEYLTCALTQGSKDEPGYVIVKLPSDDKKVSFEFVESFNYIDLEMLK